MFLLVLQKRNIMRKWRKSNLEVYVTSSSVTKSENFCLVAPLGKSSSSIPIPSFTPFIWSGEHFPLLCYIRWEIFTFFPLLLSCWSIMVPYCNVVGQVLCLSSEICRVDSFIKICCSNIHVRHLFWIFTHWFTLFGIRENRIMFCHDNFNRFECCKIFRFRGIVTKRGLEKCKSNGNRHISTSWRDLYFYYQLSLDPTIV